MKIIAEIIFIYKYLVFVWYYLFAIDGHTAYFNKG